MVYNIYVIFMQSDDNGFYSHKTQKSKSPPRWSSCVWTPVMGHSLFALFCFGFVLLFYDTGRWITVPGKVRERKGVLVLLQIESSLPKSHPTKLYPWQSNILASSFLFFISFLNFSWPGVWKVYYLLRDGSQTCPHHHYGCLPMGTSSIFQTVKHTPTTSEKSTFNLAVRIQA